MLSSDCATAWLGGGGVPALCGATGPGQASPWLQSICNQISNQYAGPGQAPPWLQVVCGLRMARACRLRFPRVCRAHLACSCCASHGHCRQLVGKQLLIVLDYDGCSLMLDDDASLDELSAQAHRCTLDPLA